MVIGLSIPKIFSKKFSFILLLLVLTTFISDIIGKKLDSAILERTLNDYFDNYYNEVIDMWNAARPKKPTTFKKYRKSLHINGEYETDHHLISNHDLTEFMKSVFSQANQNSRKRIVTLLVRFVIRHETITEEIMIRGGLNEPRLIMKAIRACLLWNPGNIVPGPRGEKRKSDPGSKFDQEIFDHVKHIDKDHYALIRDAMDIVFNPQSDYERKLALFNIWTEIYNRYETKVLWSSGYNKRYVAYCSFDTTQQLLGLSYLE